MAEWQRSSDRLRVCDRGRTGTKEDTDYEHLDALHPYIHISSRRFPSYSGSPSVYVLTWRGSDDRSVSDPLSARGSDSTAPVCLRAYFWSHSKNPDSSVRSAQVFLIITACFALPAIAQQAPPPVAIIFDTDLGPDSDDAGALALLHTLQSQNEAELLAVMCGTKSPWCAPSADVINTYYGRPDVPIGTLKGPGPAGTSSEWSGETFNGYLTGRFENDLRHGEYAEDAVALYRRILAAAADASVAVAATGPLTNLQDLLESTPDEIDARNGVELVADKVRILSVMGGRYPSGQESNFAVDGGAARHVADEWPTPVMFSGFELGVDLLTGSRLHTETPADNPVRVAYHLWDLYFARRFTPDFDPQSGIWPHSSFDQTAVLYAVRGLQDYWTAESVGRNMVGEDGSNAWQEAPDRDHAYLVERMPREELARIIEDLMVAPPR